MKIGLANLGHFLFFYQFKTPAHFFINSKSKNAYPPPKTPTCKISTHPPPKSQAGLPTHPPCLKSDFATYDLETLKNLLYYAHFLQKYTV